MEALNIELSEALVDLIVARVTAQVAHHVAAQPELWVGV